MHRVDHESAATTGQESGDPVLVVGATGRTGRLVVNRLVERQVPVHALVRDPAKGRETLPPEVKQFVGDLRRPETLAASMGGVRSVLVLACGTAEHANSPELVDYLGTRGLLREAAAAGVDFVVFASSIYVSRPDYYQDVDPASLGWKARAEELIRESGLAYCIVRAGWLTDGPGGAPLVVSQGDVAEGHLSRAGLAELCTRALFLDGARAKTFEVVEARAGAAPNVAEAIAALEPDALGSAEVSRIVSPGGT